MDYNDYLEKNRIDLTIRDLKFELGNLITEARLYKGLTQMQLAEKIGTKQPSIARVENGDLEPSVSFLDKIAMAIGTELILPKFKFMCERETSPVSYVYGTFSENDFKFKVCTNVNYGANIVCSPIVQQDIQSVSYANPAGLSGNINRYLTLSNI